MGEFDERGFSLGEIDMEEVSTAAFFRYRRADVFYKKMFLK